MLGRVTTQAALLDAGTEPTLRTRTTATCIVGGVPVSVLTMPRAIAIIASWITLKQTRQISTADVHAIMRAGSDAALMTAFRSADLVTADGAPVALASRLATGSRLTRVPGPDLMLEACRQGVVLGWKHYIYGGAEGVAETLARKLAASFPGIEIVGTECPPFRPLDDAEKTEVARRINDSGADIVWVGLGCPKQDYWMQDMRPLIHGAVMVGVGAAFDFHSGRIGRAPAWMRRAGLEWLHRLASEPRRLWRRYLVLAPRFVARVLAPSFGVAILRAFSTKGAA